MILLPPSQVCLNLNEAKRVRISGRGQSCQLRCFDYFQADPPSDRRNGALAASRATARYSDFYDNKLRKAVAAAARSNAHAEYRDVTLEQWCEWIHGCCASNPCTNHRRPPFHTFAQDSPLRIVGASL